MAPLTEIVGKVRSGDGEVSPRDILPLLAQAPTFPTDCRIRWAPADVEAGGTHDDVDLMLDSVRSLDTVRGYLLDGLGDNRGILGAQGLQISIPGRGSSTPDSEVLRNNPIRNFGPTGELGPHILFGILATFY